MNTYKPTIVVFGATGTVGRALLNILNKKECIVRAVLRNASRKKPLQSHENLSYIYCDLENPEEIKHACKFADAIFLLTATSPSQVKQEISIINIANRLKVKRIVKLSAPLVDASVHVEVAEWHREIEAHLQSQSIDYPLLRPYSFMQNWERHAFTIRKFGKIFSSLGESSRTYIDCRDVAEIAMKALLSKEDLHGNIYTLVGPEALTNSSIATKLSRFSGREIKYTPLSRNEYHSLLINRAKLPKWLATHIVELDEFSKKVPEPNQNNLEILLGKKPRIIDTYFTETKHLYAPLPFWKFTL